MSRWISPTPVWWAQTAEVSHAMEACARAFYTIAQLAMSTAAKTPKNAGAASAAVPRSANV